MKEIDITKSEFVPKHIIMNEDEKLQLLNEFKITIRQLPRISVNDPVIKQIGGKIGDVIKIVRDSPVAGESVYYRVVIRGL
ncbi:MAG: DNA-directed RNA polymerase subunit H [Candidatus Aenigmarchaeota archaeon]|nr:DNA-directed RNA polymerase subunit H [Candidatus Aenigmarchaeota archaeon]